MRDPKFSNQVQYGSTFQYERFLLSQKFLSQFLLDLNSLLWISDEAKTLHLVLSQLLFSRCTLDSLLNFFST